MDKYGGRLDKGGGYGDMEISHLLDQHGIELETPIVSIVQEVPMMEKCL